MIARILVVEDDPFARTLLRGQVEQLGYKVVGDTAIASDAVRLAHEQTPDVMLVDLDLGRGPTGADLAHAVRRTQPRIGVVVLTSYTDPRLAGTHRPLPIGSRLLIKRTLTDVSVLADALSGAAADPLGEIECAAVPAATGLSDEQVELLRLVALGCSNAEIARRRYVTESAVVKSITRLAKALDVGHDNATNLRVGLTRAYVDLCGTGGTHRE